MALYSLLVNLYVTHGRLIICFKYLLLANIVTTVESLFLEKCLITHSLTDSSHLGIRYRQVIKRQQAVRFLYQPQQVSLQPKVIRVRSGSLSDHVVQVIDLEVL